MVRNRRGLAPWSLAREAGIESATVDGTIEVPQYVQPTLDTGFVDEKGNWKGVKSSDTKFKFYQKDEAIANGADFVTAFGMDMTGFNDIIMAIRPTNGGNVAFNAVMGSDGTQSYANLTPVTSATILRGNMSQTTPADIETLFSESNENCVVDVWNIFYIGSVLRNQKLLQFSLVNNSGDVSTIETTFLRIV